METLICSDPISIAKSEPIGDYRASHDVRVTLQNGRVMTLIAADFGYREYPHPGYNLVVIGENTANAHVMVSDPKINGGHGYDPIANGRYYAIRA